MEESLKKWERAVARREGSREAAANIAARVSACVEEALVAVSPQRPSMLREEVMEQLESTT